MRRGLTLSLQVVVHPSVVDPLLRRTNHDGGDEAVVQVLENHAHGKADDGTCREMILLVSRNVDHRIT